MNLDPELIAKYNVPGPRYTSYPTVPFWKENTFSKNKWIDTARQAFESSNEKEGMSIYIHLPFCESLCTFCGCHKRITKNHDVERPYIDTLIKEWKLYLRYFDAAPKIKELHLGGGTPTFFKPDHLKRLITEIFSRSTSAENLELSFEAHPNNTTTEHLQTLYNLGFKRISLGVQDYNESVQIAIHRIQSFESVKQVTEAARKIGYNSIGHDLIFGLPQQKPSDIIHTIQKTQTLRPDRIAFYSYAHVPWVKGVGQRGFDENDLPKEAEKRALYEIGKQMLFDAEYQEIGMDHFALQSDSLYQAIENKTLHRNFMGYTHHKTRLMVGLGMSAISDSWHAFAQNLKEVEHYQHEINSGNLAVFRGHVLDNKELIVRQHILNIMCRMTTNWAAENMQFEELPHCLQRLAALSEDGLVEIKNQTLTVLEHARPFVRNVCMAFDLDLIKAQPTTKMFSMTV